MLHPVLNRQLRRLGLDENRAPADAAAWTALLARISKAYQDADNDRYTLERSTAISSREMQELYESLRRHESVLQQERDRLQAVVAAIGDGLCVLEPDGAIRFANEAATRLLGVEPTALTGLALLDAFRAVDDHPQDTLDDEHLVRVDDGLLQRRDGAVLPVSYVLTPIVAAGERLGSVLVFRDITRQKVEQVTLRQSLELAQSANRAKSEFLAVMSHELRTPISGVIGLTHLLLDLPLAADARDYAEAIAQSGQALMTVINDILDLSKIEAGRLVLEQTPFALREPIEQALEVVALPAQEKGVELTGFLMPALPEIVVGDPARLRQILLNLLGNAVKFTDHGDVEVRADVTAIDGDRATIAISVRDTGIGIPAAAHERLFAAFTQVDSSTSRRYGGTGLGLAISRRLARSMGGDLTFVSEEGHGSTFTCTIPVALAPTADQPSALPLDGVRILVASGHAPTREAIDLLCRTTGADATTTDSSGGARSLLLEATTARTTFHAILVDRALTDGDGLEFLARLARDPLAGSVVRLCISGWPRRPSNVDLEQHGVHRALVKPLRRDDFVRALRTLVESDAEPDAALQLRATPRTARVLIAEDNPIGQKVALRMLQKRGCEAVVVADGAAAIAACSAGSFDLVLMDCQMPVCDGFAATQAIRAMAGTARSMPIVALTANALEGDRERCIAAGMDDYLAKPLTPQALDTVLDRWLEAPRA